MSTSYYQGCMISITELGTQYISKIYTNGNGNCAMEDSPKSPIELGEHAAIVAAEKFIDERTNKSRH
jgi:hypothetical protein